MSIERIYEASIPASERKPTAWLGEAVGRSYFAVLVAEAHGVAVGFATVFIPTGSAALMEYLAVDCDRRGSGLGSKLFVSAATHAGKQPLLIEVEIPIDEIARQRIAFYERQGCAMIDCVGYILPLPTNPPPMRLMTFPANAKFTPESLRRSLEQIYTLVYAQEADDPRIELMIGEFSSTTAGDAIHPSRKR